MEKTIEIDLLKKEDLFEKYNKKVVSSNLINYLIDTTSAFYKDDTIKVTINNKIKDNIDIENLIKEGLQKEYTKSLNRHYHNNIVQFIYLLIGVLGLFISTLIKMTVLKEIVLIGGWVFIWALLETEIFTDIKGRTKRRVIQKLLSSEFEEIK